MTELYNLVFVGNLAIDRKHCVDGKIVEVFGGSAYNSFCTSKILYQNLYSAFFTPLGRETKKAVLNQYNLNRNIENDVVFDIDEIDGTCEMQLSPCRNNTRWSCKHLHISLRRDIDTNSFLNGSIDYESLSVDVTQRSVKNYRPLINTIKDKINFLFCNASEYEYIKDINIKGLFVVTNEEKPVFVKSTNLSNFFIVPTINCPVKSITGAGDSFIGGFLSEYIINGDLGKSVAAGIAAGQTCLNYYGNEHFEKNYYYSLFNKYKSFNLQMPNRIFIVGPSNAGKTTLINNNQNLFFPYSRFDDLMVLKERVNFDNGEIEPLQPMTFHAHEEKLPHATIKKDESSFKIIDDDLWRDVMRRLNKKLSDFSLVEFSRGDRQQYLDALGEVVNLNKDNRNIIVFVDASFNTRYYRNLRRREMGGHFVELDTFNTVYKNSCSDLFSDVLLIGDKRIPIITIINENDSTSVNAELEEKILFIDSYNT
jgi:hypothetical protein